MALFSLQKNRQILASICFLLPVLFLALLFAKQSLQHNPAQYRDHFLQSPISSASSSSSSPPGGVSNVSLLDSFVSSQHSPGSPIFGDFRLGLNDSDFEKLSSEENEVPFSNGEPGASVASNSGDSSSIRTEKCDLFMGTWVKDSNYPVYQPGSCPYVDEAFDCQTNGRIDSEYVKWRWKPSDCDLPRFNATDFLERLRGKRLLLVGDSMNRNQFESILCLLREGLQNKSRMYEVHGHKITKGRGYYVFKFQDYSCSVEFVRSHFLVREGVRINGQGNSNPILSIDVIDKTSKRWKRADILVFNTGHWWTHGKTSRGHLQEHVKWCRKNYFKEGDTVYPKFDAVKAYRQALRTWANWVDNNVNPRKQLVFYRGYSSPHFRVDILYTKHYPSLIVLVEYNEIPHYIFEPGKKFHPKARPKPRCSLQCQTVKIRGGEWDSGGSCKGETEPVLAGAILNNYPQKMKIVEEVIKDMRVPVVLLNVTRLTNFRRDGHPSIYGKPGKISTRRQDCSHWCLPGVPDAWNELIYAYLVSHPTTSSS